MSDVETKLRKFPDLYKNYSTNENEQKPWDTLFKEQTSDDAPYSAWAIMKLQDYYNLMNWYKDNESDKNKQNEKELTWWIVEQAMKGQGQAKSDFHWKKVTLTNHDQFNELMKETNTTFGCCEQAKKNAKDAQVNWYNNNDETLAKMRPLERKSHEQGWKKDWDAQENFLTGCKIDINTNASIITQKPCKAL